MYRDCSHVKDPFFVGLVCHFTSSPVELLADLQQAATHHPANPRVHRLFRRGFQILGYLTVILIGVYGTSAF